MKAIEVLQGANQKLISIKPDRNRDTGKEYSRFEGIRSKASAAASILGPESGFNCPCHQDHVAYIKLPDWPGFQDQKKGDQFSLLFQNRAPNSKWQYMEMSSYITEVDDTYPPRESAKTKGEKPRQVRFEKVHEEEGNETSYITINMRAETITESTSHSLSVEFQEPQSLCNHIGFYHEQMNQQENLKFLLAVPGLRLQMDPMSTSENNYSPLTLEEHFSGRGDQSFTAIERLRLSTQIASMVLCLYSTPWLSESWSSTDIYLQHHSDHGRFNPWTVKSLGTKSVRTLGEDSASSPFDLTIFSFCRFLVALWFGAPWSSVRKVYASSIQPGVTDESEDRRVIEMILKWSSDETISPHDRPFFEEGHLYADAVRNCLECDFGQTESSMTNRTFREGVYKNILSPLRWATESCLNTQLKIFGEALKDSTQNKTLDKQTKAGAGLFDDDRHVDKTKSVPLYCRDSTVYKTIARNSRADIGLVRELQECHYRRMVQVLP